MHFRIGAGTKADSMSPASSVALAEPPRPQAPAAPAVIRREPSVVLGLAVVRAASDLAARSGVTGWSSLHVHVGLGFATIDADMPDGSVTRCTGTSEAFGTARSALFQHMRGQADGRIPEFGISVAASAPEDVRIHAFA